MTDAREYRCILAAPDLPSNDNGALVIYYEVACKMHRHERWAPAKDCHLWLLVPPEHLGGVIVVADGLGFRYVTNASWVFDRPKTTKHVEAQHAHLALCTRGKAPSLPHRGAAMFHAPDPAPRKVPDKAYELIEKVSPGPRLELYAIERRDGWDATRI